MAKSLIFNMAAAAILDFVDVNFAGKTSCGTSFSVSVSNLVRIGSKMIEYILPFN